MITMVVPTAAKIYHIVHVDRLPSIIAEGQLWCDAEMIQRGEVGTSIGIPSIKQSRLDRALNSYPKLRVGDCAPFYFCPRSIMLYVISKANSPDLSYRGGQGPIIHLEADLLQAVAWANANNRRWVFTTSNAGSSYFDDYADIAYLSKMDWDAVHARYWQDRSHGKQAEFLMEKSFPWHLVTSIGVRSAKIRDEILEATSGSNSSPPVQIKLDWYY